MAKNSRHFGGFHSVFEPQDGPAFDILPSTGTAANGKPIFSYDQAAAQIDRDGGWNLTFGASLTITYAFRSTAPAQMPEDTSGFSRFTSAEITATEMALQQWADVANITFLRVGAGTTGNGAYSNNATILFGNYSAGADGAAAFTYLATPGQTGVSSVAGDVWVNSTLPENQSFNNLEYGPQVLLHEIGHALGLDHPGDYNASADPNANPTYDADAVYWQDTRMFTVMSYFGSANTGGSLPGFASGPQLHDIAAIQLLYGANMNTRTGDTVYGFNSNTGETHFAITSGSQGAVFAIWDGGGNDTLDLSGYSTESTIDLRPESFSSAGPADPTSGQAHALYNIAIAKGVIIENAIGGSANDIITGNDVHNLLVGNDGADQLDGGAGADTMIGGTGDDQYWVNDPGDVVTEASNEGNDGVTVSGIAAYVTPQNVERFDAGAGVLTLIGNDLNNVLSVDLSGNMLDHRIDGGAGADAMHGGFGNDTYVVDNPGDTISDPGGHNIVETYLATTSFADVQEVHLMGNAVAAFGDDSDEIFVGNDLANTLDGRVGDDQLSGNGGNDVLTGGEGADTLNGGLGFDTSNYSSASTADSWHRNPDGSWTVTAGSEGTDTLTSVERAHFTDRDVYLDPAQQTFSGDGTSDILWRRSDGFLATWSMNGAVHAGSANLGGVDNSWKIAGTGDFNGDGKDDIAWLKSDGTTAIWEMNSGGATLATGGLGGVGTNWHIAGIGDFNTDGKDDLLWKSDAGQYAIWDMNGLAAQSKAVIGSVGAEWSVQAVADFNGDGSDDILWRRSDGLVAEWNTNGTAQTGSANVGAVGNEWSIVGTGDFNDDGRADILWQRADGATAIWEMNGATQIASGVIGYVGTTWHVAGVGDYNGDGHDDIFWRSDSGQLAVWTMNGLTIETTGNTGSITTDWGII